MDLRVLGWNAHWRDLFDSYVSDRYVSNQFVPGRVVAAHRGAYSIETEAGGRSATLSGRLRHDTVSRAELPAVGDFVAVRVSAHDAIDEPAFISAVLPRQTAFIRRSAGNRSEDQVIAANVDVVFVVAGLDHDFNVRRIERYLTAVWDGGAVPVILLNKSDLCDAVSERIAELHRIALGVTVHGVSALHADGLDAVQAYFGGNTTVAVVGSSGVGKSTLLNRLLGRDVQPTAEVRAHDQRGRHTTTRRELFVLPRGGVIIDTPGLRELQLSAPSQEEVGTGLDRVFSDIGELAERCRFSDCTHRGEHGCAVRQAVEDGLLDVDRITAYEKLVKELRYEAARSDGTALSDRKRAGRIGAKAMRRMSRERRR